MTAMISKTASGLPSATQIAPSELLGALDRQAAVIGWSNPDYSKARPDDCRAILAIANEIASKRMCDDAAAYGMQLVGCFRARDFVDVETFAAALTATLALYPPAVVRLAVCPINGLPSKAKFVPSIAEVRAHLDEICDRINIHAPKAAKALEFQQGKAA